MSAPVPSEEIAIANSAAPAPAPQLTPAQKLAEEYELPNSDFDPDQFKPAGAGTTQPVADAPPPPEAAPAAPKHSKRVLRMAEQFGISQAEIDATEPEALDEALVVLQRQMLDDRQRLIAQPGRQAEPAAQAPAAPKAPEAFDLGIPAEEMADIHPSIASALKKLAAEVQDLRGLKGTLGTIQQREQQREFDSFQQRCDAAFARHETVLGKGSYGELNPQGPELRRRQAVLDTAQRDNPKIPFEKRIERAVEALFGKQTAAAAPLPIGDARPTEADLITRDSQGRITGRITPAQWNAAATARPSHREAPILAPGKEKATKFVADKMKERDYFSQEGVNGTPQTEEETLPE